MSIMMILLASMAQATVLTFDISGISDGSLIPQTYGDYVSSTSMWGYAYGETGEGYTPNIDVEYIGVGNGLHFWGSDYGDLINVVENEDDYERWTIFRFTADDGCEAILKSVDLSNYNASPLLIDRIIVTNESGTVLYEQSNLTLGGSGTGHTNLNFGSITGQVLTFVLDLQTAAASGYNDSVALDNITFGQTGSPTTLPPSIDGSVLIDFEEYAAGSPPPSPWVSDAGVSVVNSVSHGGTNSLQIGYTFYDLATYPLIVEANETASFSAWVRPGTTELNYVNLGGIGIQVFGADETLENKWSADFVRDLAYNGGDTSYSIRWDHSGGAQGFSGDFSPGYWYPVICEITLSNVTFSITTQSGLLTHSFDREGRLIAGINLRYSNGSGLNSYYDDLLIAPPPVAPTNVALNVYSELGSPVPANGINSYLSGNSVTCFVENVTSGLTNYSCTGWIGTGSVPASGTSNAVIFTVSEGSSITWNWQTNYWLEVSVSGSGTVAVAAQPLWSAPDTVGAFEPAGSNRDLSATPDSGWLFMGWSGDASGTNAAAITMDTPKSITANFSDDADNDGLTNTDEAAAGSNPWKSDTDDDGFGDAFEVAKGWNPTIDDSDVVDYISANGDEFGLYPSNAVLDVALGQVLLDISGGSALLNLQLEESDDLVTWTNAGDAVEWNRSVDGDKQFFRVRAGK